MYVRIIKGVAVIGTVLALSACESTSGVKDEGQVQQPPVSDQSGTSTAGAGSATGSGFQGNPLDDPASLLSNRTIYFEYDSSDIPAADQPVVEAHGRYLADNPGASLTLEGHADERGSREYNIALGERRANAVRQLMTLIGANGAQIRVVSYGEERPAVDGHDEAAWSRNRRVEIIYRDR
jgi:peptidoglycan-associated lipoprotein